MADRLAGKVALITGGGSGIGAATARRFVEEGAQVVVADLNVDSAEAVASELGGKTIGVAIDVVDRASIRTAIERTVAEFGGLDVLVCNAGVTIVGSVMDLTEDEWDKELDTNLKSVFLCAKEAWDHLAARGGGSILSTASMAGQWAIPADAAYCASKAGLIHLTHALAMEWARYQIRVNAICPGYIETEMNGDFWKTPGGQRLIDRIPQRRIGQPEHLDGALLLLASEAGAFMTGSVITVDGGHLVSSL